MNPAPHFDLDALRRCQTLLLEAVRQSRGITCVTREQDARLLSVRDCVQQAETLLHHTLNPDATVFAAPLSRAPELLDAPLDKPQPPTPEPQ